MPDAIEASAAGFRALARGELDQPRRTPLSRERALLMSAEHSSGSAVVKLVSLDADGWAHGRPSMDGVVVWLEAETGRAGTLIDAAALTSLRTGAASGLATSLLAPAEASVLAMLGAGELAADQVAAVCAVREVREVRIWSRRRRRAEELRVALEGHGCGSPGGAGPLLVISDDARDAVRGADVVCTATRATAPLFEAGDLSGNAHVNAVGAYRHEMRELPPDAFASAAVVAVDQLAAALAEAGDLVAAVDAGALDLKRLVTISELLDRPAPSAGRGITIFKSVGVAAQDWSIADLVARRVRAASDSC